MHFLAQPLFHLAIVCERVRATLSARTYEVEGRRFGLVQVALIVSSGAICPPFILILVDFSGHFHGLFAGHNPD